jgi:hypothetical protein
MTAWMPVLTRCSSWRARQSAPAGPVTSLAALSLAPVFRRGHGALYDALADGAVDEDRLRDLLAGQLPAGAPLMFGIGAATCPRPDAGCSPDRGLPKTTRPGPGRPPGGKNTPAPCHRLGSELRKPDTSKKAGGEKKG